MKTAIALIFTAAQLLSAMDTVSTPVTTFQEKPYHTAFREWSSDGTQRIEGCTDGKIRVFRPNDTLPVKELTVSASGIATLKLTPDRTFLMVFASDSTLYRIDLSDYSVLPCHLPPLIFWQVIAFSYDGLQCISWSRTDSSFVLHNLSTGENKPCFSGIRGDYSQLFAQFAPDGKKIFALHVQNSFVQMRTTDNDSILFSQHLADTVVADAGISFSSDGKRIALPMNTTGSAMIPYALLMESESGTIVDTMQLKAGTGTIQLNFSGEAFSLSHDGTKLLAGNSFIFAVYDMTKRSLIFSWNRQWSNYSGYSAWFSTDDMTAFVNLTDIGSHTDSLIRWDVATKQPQTVGAHREWPDIIASGFSAEGPLLLGKYRYDLNGSEKQWDSLVYFNPVTGRELLPKKYLLTNESFDPKVTWSLSDDGTMLYEKIFHYRPVSADIPVGELNVYSLETGSGLLFSRTLASEQVVVSQQKRHLCIFDSSACTIISCDTFDSTKATLAIPAGWIITTVDLDAQLVCAFTTERKPPSDTLVCTAGIWSLATGAGLKQFITGRYSSFDNDLHDMGGRFLPDGVHLIVNAGGARNCKLPVMSLFDIRTGTKIFDYPGSRCVNDMALTPDGRQVIAGVQDSGICCYDALSGTPQRFFTTRYQEVPFLFAPFPFNPSNPRQFMAGCSVWELPEPLAVMPSVSNRRSSPVKIASFTRRGIILAGQQSEPVTVRIFRPDGRQVVRVTVPSGTSVRRFVPLQDIADGMYVVRLEYGMKMVSSCRIVSGRG